MLYYGLASAIRLPAFVAALLGLALNYAAYESEIYRSALEAISTGQLEAARPHWGSANTAGAGNAGARRPRRSRLALAPMTNDFIALLKDSSLVSVLTVLELTKQTQIFATNLGSWVIPGTLCAGLYLAMSLPPLPAAAALRALAQTDAGEQQAQGGPLTPSLVSRRRYGDAVLRCWTVAAAPATPG